MVLTVWLTAPAEDRSAEIIPISRAG